MKLQKLSDYIGQAFRGVWDVAWFILICTLVPVLLIWLLTKAPAQFLDFIIAP